jgi:hypothetical protein
MPWVATAKGQALEQASSRWDVFQAIDVPQNFTPRSFDTKTEEKHGPYIGLLKYRNRVFNRVLHRSS